MPKGEPVFLFGAFTVDDLDAFRTEYQLKVLPTLQAADAHVLAATGAPLVNEGAYGHNWTILISFPSHEDYAAWYTSDEYAPLAEIRRRLTDPNSLMLLLPTVGASVPDSQDPKPRRS